MSIALDAKWPCFHCGMVIYGRQAIIQHRLICAHPARIRQILPLTIIEWP